MRTFTQLCYRSLNDLVPAGTFYRHLEAKLDLASVRDLVSCTYGERGRDYGELARQDRIDLHFDDEALRHRLAKRISNSLCDDVPLMIVTALRPRARIPNDRFDFDRAKDDMLARTSP